MTSWPYQGGQEKTSLLPLKNMAILFGTPKYCYATLSAFAFPRQTETADSCTSACPLSAPMRKTMAVTGLHCPSRTSRPRLWTNILIPIHNPKHKAVLSGKKAEMELNPIALPPSISGDRYFFDQLCLAKAYSFPLSSYLDPLCGLSISTFFDENSHMSVGFFTVLPAFSRHA